MNITHITEHNYFDPDSQSGSPYWISKSLAQENINLHNLHISLPLKLLPPIEELKFRCKQMWLKLSNREHLSSDIFVRRARHIAN